LIHCALPPWKAWTGVINGEETLITGLMGLASDLIDFPMWPEQRFLVSACLLSSINYFGKPIQISNRNNPMLGTEKSEMKDFRVYEGAFFGDIFEDDSKRFGCRGTRNAVALAQSADRQWRRCTDEGYDCGIEIVGDCIDHCELYSEDYGYSICSGPDGMTYPAINIFLQANN